MKKTKRKKSNPENSTKVAAMIEPELNELIAGIENEIKIVEHDNSGDTQGFEKSEKRVDIGRHICIELRGRQLAIPLSSVLEAGEDISVQQLPLLPDWITGIANNRGEIISVVNLHLFFDIKSTPSSVPDMSLDTRPYLIVHNDHMKIVITVDKILATRPLYSSISKKSEKEIEKKDMLSKHLSGLAFYEKDNFEKEIFIFDLDKFLSSGNLHDFSIA